MAINYAEKYSDKVDERFTKASVTQAAFNQDFDWEGVQAVNVYSIATAPLNDYVASGTERYGVADEIGSTTQTMTLTQDKSFTFTIDRKSYQDAMGTHEAGSALRRQVDEVMIPHIDQYRISALVAGSGTTSAVLAITKTNAYESFLTGVTTLLDNKAPLAGTFAYVSNDFYKNIRLDTGFIQASDMAQTMLVTGQVGMIENIPLIYVPTSYLPTGTAFVLTNRIAAVAPVKLSDYRTHDNPPGINGWLVEGRVRFGAFVLNNKAKAIYVHKSA